MLSGVPPGKVCATGPALIKKIRIPSRRQDDTCRCEAASASSQGKDSPTGQQDAAVIASSDRSAAEIIHRPSQQRLVKVQTRMLASTLYSPSFGVSFRFNATIPLIAANCVGCELDPARVDSGRSGRSHAVDAAASGDTHGSGSCQRLRPALPHARHVHGYPGKGKSRACHGTSVRRQQASVTSA